MHAWTVRRRETGLRLVDAATTARRPRGAGQWALLAGVLVTVAGLILLPLAVLVERSLGASGLGYYRALTRADGGTFLVPPIEAIGNSLQYAVAATAIAVVIGGLAAAALTRRDAGRFVRGFDALLMLPLGVSAVTVGFGFLIALDEPPLDLRSSWILVPLAQALCIRDRGSRSRCRSGSSGRRSSSRGPTVRRCRWPWRGCWGGRGR